MPMSKPEPDIPMKVGGYHHLDVLNSPPLSSRVESQPDPVLTCYTERTMLSV
jgi:hypothetical protein